MDLYTQTHKTYKVITHNNIQKWDLHIQQIPFVWDKAQHDCQITRKNIQGPKSWLRAAHIQNREDKATRIGKIMSAQKWLS